MKYLPSYKIFLLSPLGSDEILRRLKEKVQPKKIVRFDFSIRKNEEKPYEGSIYSRAFFINKIYYSTYRFRPDIEGKLRSVKEGSRIEIKMAPDMSMWTYFAVPWIILIIYLGLLFSGELKEASLSFNLFFPVFAVLIVPAMIFFEYNPKVSSAKEFLIDLFEAKEISKPQSAQ